MSGAAPAAEAAITPEDGARTLVLTGLRPGAPLNPVWTGFLTADGVDALVAWFGRGATVDLAKAPDALRHAIDRDIVALDRMIAAQLDAILHHPRMQALEGSWRGMHWLVHGLEDGPGDKVVVRMLGASWREIARDMERASDFDQSLLFRKVYEEQFGTAGGEPIGLLVVDHAVRHRASREHPTDDIGTLERLTEIGAAAFAPIVVGAAPELLEVEGFGALAAVADPAAALANADHTRWRRLAARIDARFLAVALPRVLARPPWRDDGARGDGFRYRERAAAAADRVWMNAGYAFATVVARAVARFGWPADVRGADTDRTGGGLVNGVPADPHRLSPTLSLPRLPIEVVFLDRQERGLIEAGLMPLGALPYGEELLFGAVRSLYRPPPPAGPAAREVFADSRVATQMNAVLCAARFAHYLKVRGRDTIGRLREPSAIERELRDWLTGFVNRNVMATAETRATHPLYDASVRVTELPDRPGVFTCAIMLQPYFQLDNVTSSFNFETEIVPPAA